MGSLNKLSYPQRLFVWLLGYSLLMVGCFVIFQYHREKEFKAEEIDKQLQLINTYILTELSEGHDVPDIKLDEFKPFNDIRVSVISDKGHIIYDNTLDSLPKTNHLDRQEIRDAMLNGSGYAVRRHSESTGNYYFYSARKGDYGNIVRTAFRIVQQFIAARLRLFVDNGNHNISHVRVGVLCNPKGRPTHKQA